VEVRESRVTEIGLRVGDTASASYFIIGQRESSDRERVTVLGISDQDDSVQIVSQVDGIEMDIPYNFVKKFKRNGRWYDTITNHIPSWSVTEGTLSRIQSTSRQAQRYVAKAIRKLRQESYRKHIIRWYGRANMAATQERLSELLNNLDNMLNNVYYVYPGGSCKPNVFAYVQPTSFFAKNNKGQFIFYLCDLYFKQTVWARAPSKIKKDHRVRAYYHVQGGAKSGTRDYGTVEEDRGRFDVTVKFQDGIIQDVDRSWVLVSKIKDQSNSIQIETLTHEGSHHKPSRTADVCTDGSDRNDCDRAYGRDTCKELLEDFPRLALNNADTLCFLINDMNGDFDR